MKKIFYCCGVLLMNLQAVATTLSGSQSSLSLTTGSNGVQARLSFPGMGDFAVGPYVWQASLNGTEQDGLKGARIELIDKRTMLVTGMLGPLEVEQRFSLLENSSGFAEVISLHNPTDRDVLVDDIRTGFTREVDPATDPYRLVAVPYRRQAGGSMHDYSMADVAAVTRGSTGINPTCQPAWPPHAPLVDEQHRRLRSESWVLTDGTNGLLVLKYNNQAVEHSAVNWIAEENRLVFGGCAYVLHKEPVQSNRIQPGATFHFGETRYLSYEGGWPQGYELFKNFLNSRGHGLTDEYDPQVQWNILFDLGDQRWPREKVLEQASLAKEVGCTRIYFDPGWQVPISAGSGYSLLGSSLWDEPRLGPVADMVSLLKNEYGLELGLWSAASVGFDSQWPREYFRKTIVGLMNAPRVIDGHRNLALLPEARASASSVFANGTTSAHQTSHLNDGVYGNRASWIAGEMPARIEIDLGRVYSISEVCLGNDNSLEYMDRAASSFRILTAARYSADSTAETWRVAASYQQYGAPLKKRMSFSFAPVTARWVRVELLEPVNELVRVDEIEIYETEAGTDVNLEKEADSAVELQALPELCMSDQQWRNERYRRLSKLAAAGVTFFMFDFHGWTGPCYADDHGHPVPSSTSDHINTLYGLSRELRQEYPGLRIEMHDAVWPWGSRYLPGYYRQGLRDGDYDENWGYEFMWNSIHDLRSGKALCLYYYNLACDIPMYLHFNMTSDNDQSLVFWWMASTVRHVGFGGFSNAARKEPHGALPELTPQQHQARFNQYKNAMASYNRLKRYFTHGRFVGIDGDETLHLHTLPGRPGGVLMVFNLTQQAQTRTVRVPMTTLNLEVGKTPKVVGAEARVEGQDLTFELNMEPESPRLIEIETPKSTTE